MRFVPIKIRQACVVGLIGLAPALTGCLSRTRTVPKTRVADVIMSLDNVLAVAAAAKGSVPLLVIGLALSVPLVIFGSALLLKVMERFPVLVIAGGILIGYVAGDVAVGDPAVGPWVGTFADTLEIIVPLACAALVVPAAHLLTKWTARRRKEGEI